MARDRLIARRKAQGFTQASLAYALSCERSTVARWERDESEVSAHLRLPLADALGWSLTELDAAMNGHAIPRPAHGWFSNYEALEQSATLIRTWEPMVVPGLLQTREYAAALSNDELAARRIDRQRIIRRADRPVELTAVVDESALYRSLGHPGVLAAQLGHLTTMARRDNVTVHVLERDASAQAVAMGGKGAFVVLQFSWPGGLVHLEHQGGARSLDTFQEIDTHARAFDGLRDLALPPAESLARIVSATQELDS